MQYRMKLASNLAVGDGVVNMGPILSMSRYGVFICTRVDVEVPDLHTGKIERISVGQIWHESAEILTEIINDG